LRYVINAVMINQSGVVNMGGEGRAEMEAERLGTSSFTKKFIKFLLGKCGNCAFRIVCWSKLFPDKGELIMAYQRVYRCEGVYKGNAEASFDGKQVVKFINTCANCTKYREHCMCKILDSDEFIGMVEATSDDVHLHVQALIRCSKCPDNERCWSEILKGLGFGWQNSPQIIGIIAKCKFTGKYQKMEMIE